MDLDTKIQDDNFLNQHTWQDNIPTDFEGATDHIYEANDRDQHRTLVNRAMTSRVTLTTLNAMKSELNCLLQVSLTSETIFLRWKIPSLPSCPSHKISITINKLTERWWNDTAGENRSTGRKP